MCAECIGGAGESPAGARILLLLILILILLRWLKWEEQD
jgi:hypothetical protein